MISKRLSFSISLVAVLIVIFLADARPLLADWPQFRGVNSAGVAEGAAPIEFGPGKNELWRLPIGSGHSSPCIVGDNIFLTTYDKAAKKLELLCIGRGEGKIRWHRPIKVREIERWGHPSFNPASSTPTSDGKLVVAYFGSIGLVCFDVTGAKQWAIKMPVAKSYSGNATSPVIVGDRLILYRANFVDHFLLAVDKKTGKELWKKYQPNRFTTAMAAAATPIVQGNTLIIHGVRAVQGFDINDGNLLWQANCPTTATSTPILAGDETVIATWNQTGEPSQVPIFPPFDELLKENDKDGDKLIGENELPRLMYFHRSEGTDAPANGAPLRFGHVDRDRNGRIDAKEWSGLLERVKQGRKHHVPHGLMAINIKSKGEVKTDQVRYLERRDIPEVPSPIHHKGYVYFVKNGGILTCIELKTGKKIYRARTRGRGTHYASPIIADDKLYITAGDGRITVVKAGPEPEILASNDIRQRTFATPAIVDGMIYVRTHEALIAFGVKK